MLSIKTACFALVLAAFAASIPLKDVEIVESTIREVTATAPEDLLLAETSYKHDYANDEEDSVGYLKREEDGGSDGYTHFDSYHKKDGDKYGYEKHTSFGDAAHASYDAGSEDDGKEEKSSYQEVEGTDASESDSYGPSAKYISNDFATGHYIGSDAESEGLGHEYFDADESEKYTAAEGESESEASEEY